MRLRSAGPVLALLLCGCSDAPSAECTCPVVMEQDGWCSLHWIGYVAGLEIETPLLFEALDAHGHEVDLESFHCPGCKRAIETDGFCDTHLIGFVSDLAYYSRLTFLVARARKTGGEAPPCPDCREVAAAGAWCEACGGVGFAGPVAFRDRGAFEEVQRALDLVHRADLLGRRCQQCAVAMVTDSICPICKIEYRGGEGRPFVPRAPSGAAGPTGKPAEPSKDN